MAKIYKVSQVARLPVNGAELSGQVRQQAEDTLKDFPGKLNFQEPKKDEKFVIVVEQTG